MYYVSNVKIVNTMGLNKILESYVENIFTNVKTDQPVVPEEEIEIETQCRISSISENSRKEAKNRLNDG